MAWSPGASGHVINYGRQEVASDSLGLEQALMVALRELKEMLLEGWPVGTAQGQRAQPRQVFVDAGYATPVVYAFCRESGERFRPAVGRGAAQQYRQFPLAHMPSRAQRQRRRLVHYRRVLVDRRTRAKNQVRSIFSQLVPATSRVIDDQREEPTRVPRDKVAAGVPAQREVHGSGCVVRQACATPACAPKRMYARSICRS